jgi:hypothetical protein
MIALQSYKFLLWNHDCDFCLGDYDQDVLSLVTLPACGPKTPPATPIGHLQKEILVLRCRLKQVRGAKFHFVVDLFTIVKSRQNSSSSIRTF